VVVRVAAEPGIHAVLLVLIVVQSQGARVKKRGRLHAPNDFGNATGRSLGGDVHHQKRGDGRHCKRDQRDPGPEQAKAGLRPVVDLLHKFQPLFHEQLFEALHQTAESSHARADCAHDEPLVEPVVGVRGRVPNTRRRVRAIIHARAGEVQSSVDRGQFQVKPAQTVVDPTSPCQDREPNAQRG
jgi:hypothetical protein